jgi:hypothetical protein
VYRTDGRGKRINQEKAARNRKDRRPESDLCFCQVSKWWQAAIAAKQQRSFCEARDDETEVEAVLP